MTKTATDSIKPPTIEQAFEQALQRIYRIYGSDLSAFFSDVQRRLKIERSENPRAGHEGIRIPQKQS